MEARLNLITLGVEDLALMREFYERLGWSASIASQGDVVFFQIGTVVLSLFPRKLLAEDAHVSDEGTGFRGFALAQNVGSKDEVSRVLGVAENAGARILKPAQDVFWGGHCGYFADPEGNIWEVAWNPHFKLNDAGVVELP